MTDCTLSDAGHAATQLHGLAEAAERLAHDGEGNGLVAVLAALVRDAAQLADALDGLEKAAGT